MTFFGRAREGIRGGLVATVTVVGALSIASPAQAAITISDASAVAEGNSGEIAMTFTVNRTGALLQGPASVRFRTTGGTATGAVDYVPPTGGATTVSIPGSLLGESVNVQVPVRGDLLDEPAETIDVTIDQASGDSISDGLAGGTINDDDDPPSASIGAGNRAEGTGGAGYVGLPVTLSAASGRVITVPYTVTPDSATAPDDIDAAAGTLTIPAGANGGEIRVPTLADNIDEPDETFTVTIGTPTNASVGSATALGTVVNDDTPVVSVGAVALPEGTSATPTPFSFPITLSNPSTRAISVRIATADVQAIAPADYAAVDRVVTFEPGDTGQVVTVDVVADAVQEAGEAFAVTLSEPSGATLGTASVLGAILDDDAPATVPGGSVIARPVGGTPTTPATPTSTDRSAPKVRLTSLMVRRPKSIRVKVTCPATETRCTGSVTVFSVAQSRSKIKLLRRETRVARGTFTLAGGRSRTLTMKTSATGLKLLRAVKRLKVRGYGVARDAAGNVGTGTLRATLRR